MIRQLVRQLLMVLAISLVLIAATQEAVAEPAPSSSEQPAAPSKDALDTKDIIAMVFGASGWLGFILKILWDKRQVEDKLKSEKERQKSENERRENELLVKYDRRLNEPPYVEICDIVTRGANDDDVVLDGFALRQLPALLESIAHHCNAGLVSLSTVDHKYGDLFIRCTEHGKTWEGESADDRKRYWKTFDAFVATLRKHRGQPVPER